MGKSSGSTRTSSSNAPKGVRAAAKTPAQQAASRLEQQEQIAENFYRNGELMIDPGDAVYANLSGNVQNNPTAISESIENLTDYDAIVSDTYVQLLPRDYDQADLIRDYGEDSFIIPYENKTLMDVIQELRSSSMSKLFAKYRD